jgi:AcrR family transcriptional regulator
MGEQDQETRARLLNAAARLFAERGFAKVTVRDICKKARANVAAVNYHFGGKDGLYRAVVQMAIDMMLSVTNDGIAAGKGLSPEERLRAYVGTFLRRIASRDINVTWIHHLMTRELADPTDALGVVAEQVMKPRMEYLCGIIGELLGCPSDDPRAVRCALSLQAQFQMLMWISAFAKFAPGLDLATGGVEEMAEHITRFSLGGVQAVRLTPDPTDDFRRTPAGGVRL